SAEGGARSTASDRPLGRRARGAGRLLSPTCPRPAPCRQPFRPRPKEAGTMAGMTAAHAPGWLLDEVAVAGRENLDPAHVARYDAKEDAGAAAEVALLGGLGLGPDSGGV